MKLSSLWLATLALTLLTACGETTVKESLGIDRRAPDEFRVVSRPPLSIPPQFDLRPPSSEADSATSSRAKAESLVMGGNSNTKVTPVTAKALGKTSGSAADSIFLQKAGAADADPNVKQELAEKRINDQVKHEDESWWDKMTTLPGSKEPVVKAEDEAKRIEKNKDEGKPVTEGATPETGGGPISVLQHWIGAD